MVAISRFIAPAQLKGFLTTMSSETRKTILSQSHYHPSGYYQILLNIQPSGTTTRLHFWLRKPDLEYFPHTHGWDFCSFVLSGTLADMRFQEIHHSNHTNYNKKKQYQKFRNLNRKTHGQCYLEKDGRCYLREEGLRLHRSGTSYWLDGQIIHKAWPAQDRTLTLIHQEPLKYDSSLYYPVGHQVCTGNDFTPLTIEQLDEMIEFVYQISDSDLNTVEQKNGSKLVLVAE